MLKVSTSSNSLGLVTKADDLDEGGDFDEGGNESLPSGSQGNWGDVPVGENHASLREFFGEIATQDSPTNEKSELRWHHERFGFDETSGRSPVPERGSTDSTQEVVRRASSTGGRWYGSISSSGGVIGAFGFALGGSAGIELAAYDSTSVSFAGGGFLPTVGIGLYVSPFGPGVNFGYSVTSPGSSSDCFRQVNAIFPIVTFAIATDLQSNQVTQFSVSISGSIGLGIIGGVFCGASLESLPIKDTSDILAQKAQEEFGSDPIFGLVNRLYQGF